MLSAHALELAQTLVRMNTVSQNSNLELIHFIRDRLAQLGVRSRLTFNADKTKANLFATLGEGKPAGIILSGHTDTVPWTGQNWSMDPLGGQVADGRLYGRGSADMKAFIALALAHAEQFAHSPAPFAVHLAFSYDEEVGCFGVRELIADMRDAGIQPLACIVGEPTLMIPAIAHKGVYRYKCCVRGKEAHSSLTPHSVNAIEMAARLVSRVRDMAEGFEKHEPRFEGFDVPFSTASVGQFHGGIADNVVPRDAEFRYEFRDLPTANAAQMQAEVLAYARHHPPGPTAQRRKHHHPGGIRHRSRAFQKGRNPHRGVRPWQHPARTPARRVCEPGAACALRGVHAGSGSDSCVWGCKQALKSSEAHGRKTIKRAASGAHPPIPCQHGHFNKVRSGVVVGAKRHREA